MVVGLEGSWPRHPDGTARPGASSINARDCIAKTQALGYIPVPTVIRQGGFRVRIFGPPREHGPPHVHVYKGSEAVVVIRLGLPGQGIAIREIHKMKRADVVKAYRLVEAHAYTLRKAWEHIHGQAQTQ
ncbi:MAG TPA: DUF4160 domain-containing protein [Gemmatimonadaceae bacterium]|nr:DUF4160 domain-containing protein [Gemmatimonadaceae bacterium]